MDPRPEADFGDEVTIRATPETEALGYSGRTGMCLGVTTPSVIEVEVIGEIEGDRALNVSFGDQGVPDAWFSTRLVDLVSHAEGTIAKIGERVLRREADGSWSEQA